MKKMLMMLLILLSSHSLLSNSAVTFDVSSHNSQFTTENEETGDNPRIIIAQAGNFSISFVPLITLLVNAIPNIVNKFRPTQAISARELMEKPRIPTEFMGISPCLDSILTRKPYPGSYCHFYQCELYQPTTASCRIQVIEDELLLIDPLSVLPDTITVRVTQCLAIRVFQCSIGYIYSKGNKTCVRNFTTLTCPLS